MTEIDTYIKQLDREAALARTPRWVSPEELKKHGFEIKLVDAPITLFLGEAIRMKSLQAPTIDLLVFKLKEICPDPVLLFMLYPKAKDRIAEATGPYQIQYHIVSREDRAKLFSNLITLSKAGLDPDDFTYKQPFSLNLETVNTMMAIEGEQKTIEYIGQAVIEAIKREVNVQRTQTD